ncbi:endonuclease/exonuclease/phosphatase family protein [Pyxidicoccus sp. 3LG]
MPTLTVTVWNIQDYGFFRQRTRWNYVALHNFIAQVMIQQGTDILFIQELKQAGVARLTALRNVVAAAIPANPWVADSIRAAYAAGTPAGPNTNITTAANLGWTQTANREGYGILYRNNPAQFTMTAAPQTGAAAVANTQSNGTVPMGAVPANVLTLVAEGRPPAVVPASPWAYNAPVFNAGAPPAWADLDFTSGVSPNLLRNSARRPAYCVVRLNAAGGGAGALMPLMTHHSPSNGWTLNAPAASTQLASFARQLYQVRNPAAAFAWGNSNRALACGDFNIDGNPAVLPVNRQQSLTGYPAAFAASGAGMTNVAVPLGAAAPANGTTVKLTVFIGGPPIAGGGGALTFRGAQFDNTFFRGIGTDVINAPPQGVVYDLVTAVMAGGALNGAPITNFVPLVTNATAAAVAGPGGAPMTPAGNLIYPQITNWANFWGGLNAGVFPTDRSAAEFVKLFISDHLPITFRFTFL